MLRRIISFFVSLNAAIVFFCLVILFFAAGSVIVPQRMDRFSDINDMILLHWLGRAGPADSWWIYGLVLALGLVAVNTLVCGVDALVKKLPLGQALRVVSPQIVHLGVLFMLAGHLVSSFSGSRLEAQLRPGEAYGLPGGGSFVVNALTVRPEEGLEAPYWQIDGLYSAGDTPARHVSVRPALPVRLAGTWVFIKSIDLEPAPRATLMFHRDYGVFWLFSGTGVFIAGCALLLLARRIRPA